MDRKNDANGREFVETEFVRTKGSDGVTRITGRVQLPGASRTYKVGDAPLSDEEVNRQYPPLRDPKTDKILPSVFPSVMSQVKKKR